MKINPERSDKAAQCILEEMAPVLGFLYSADGVPLDVRKAEISGFAAQAQNGAVTVEYGSRVDLCRALAAIGARAGEADWSLREQCAFEEFGVSLDISRNAVLNMPTLRQFLRLAALMGYRFVSLYMEDTIALEQEPCFGNMRGAMTPDQLRALDDYADAIGIELRASVQTLAHINQITRYQVYEPIIDTDDILLVGDERTYTLLDHLLGTVAGCLRSRKINIGMDEAYMAGLGKYLEQHGYHKRTEVLLQHLNRVLAICKKYGLQAQMWSDLFFHQVDGKSQLDPTDLPVIPPEVELAYWDYYSTDEAHYRERLQQHRLMTDRIAFAGGAWKWTGFTPHNHYSIEAGKAALAACRAEGVHSVVITTWGDNGAEASVFSVLPTLYWDAQLAYGAPVEDGRFQCMTGMSLDDFLKIDLPCRFSDRPSIHNNASKYLLYQDALYGTFDSVIPADISAFYEEAARQLAPLESVGPFGYLFTTQMYLCRVLARKAALGKRIVEAYRAQDRTALAEIVQKTLPALLEDLAAFRRVFRAQWMRENKPFGFEVQTIRLGGLQARLLEIQEILQGYLDGACAQIEELEAPRIPFAYFDQGDIEQLNYNLWSNIVSPSVIG